MNYRTKRNAHKLSVYTVSSRLGIDYNTYLDVEHGKKNLEGDRLDKFQEIINNSESIRIDRAKKMIKVYEWFDSGKAVEVLNKMGYSQKKLGQKLKCSQTHISNVLNGNIKSPDSKERIYDFLTDSLNQNIEEPEIENHDKPTKDTLKNVTNVINLSSIEKENQKLMEEVKFYKDIIETMCYLKSR